MNSRRPTIRGSLCAAAALTAAITTAGCGGGGSTKGASGAFAQESKAIAAVSGQLDVSKQCAAIKAADVQALLKVAPGKPVNNPLECAWTGTDLKVDLTPHDDDKKNYTDLVSTQGHAISGLGDVAQWFEPVDGATVPDVNAHKGSLTCYVQGAGDITTTTLPYTGSDPFYKITPADSLTYATNEAKLCAAVFSAS